MDKVRLREKMLATRAADASCALVYVNQVGADELVFDGASMVFDADGDLVARAPQFVEDLLIVDLEVDAIYRKRLLDPRGRETRAALAEVRSARSGPAAGSGAAVGPAARPRRRGLRRARPRPAGLPRRTASATSCSACPAVSTLRSWPLSPPTPSAPTRLLGPPAARDRTTARHTNITTVAADTAARPTRRRKFICRSACRVRLAVDEDN